MSEPGQLVARLLNTPDIERVVPRLPPLVLHRLIERCGLDACIDIVALATPAQLRRVLDVDLWRPPVAGADEALDAERFGEWIEVLMQAGEEVAADRLEAMDFDLVVAGLADHLIVCDAVAAAPYETLDGIVVAGRPPGPEDTRELGGFLVEVRRSASWNAIVDLLVHLHESRPAFYARLMRACVGLSSGPRELDGCDTLLGSRAQYLADLAVSRESRRDREGYIAPAQARAFLQGARAIKLEAAPPAMDPILRASLYEIAEQPGDETPAGAPALADDAASMTAVMQMLTAEGVITPPRALIAGTAPDDRLAIVRAFAESHVSAVQELAFLGNVLLSGCPVQGRAFTPDETSDAVLATCNLGLENWPRAWPARDLVTAFQIGWSLLHRDLCLHAAHVLTDTLSVIECSDRETQRALQKLRRELRKHQRAGEPWLAQPLFDVLLTLDGVAWAVLSAAIAECPVLQAAVTTPGLRSVDAAAFTFASRNRDIAAARAWLTDLPSVLTG